MWYDTLIFCPECEAKRKAEIFIPVVSVEKCKKCENIKGLIKCKTCKRQRRICVSCDLKEFQGSRPKQNEPELTKPIRNFNLFSVVSVVSLCFLFLALCLRFWWNHSSESLENLNLLEKLKKDFPSQRDETWYHFLSVLEKKIPTVKSITFLHDGDRRTPDCLTDTLVSLFSGNESIQGEDITFSAAGYEGRDYGFALEHYRSVVQKFRVFVTDLTEVSGNIARIFHSLCDEFSSDIKPSLFIFTLKYDKQTEMMKPLKRAETILKEVWSDLPDNEIYPLISRVLKNVVDVVPEKSASC